MAQKRELSQAASALSKEGSAKGGRARAMKLSPQERSEIARRAVTARWLREGATPPVYAYCGGPESPVRIGGIEIPAYVLEDGRRVLAQRGLQTGVGFSRSGGKPGARRMARFMASLQAKGIDTKDLIARINNPIRFVPPHGGNLADGYEATILPDICAVVLEAYRRQKLLSAQAHIADKCRILLHGFATLGIIALVDEATGYQDHRGRDDLAQILKSFVQKELGPWVKTFPMDYYKGIYRLRGWEWPPKSNTHNSNLGKFTNDLVYDRLAPGVREELHRLAPRNDEGRLKHKLHQYLTLDVGHPKLREHLGAVVMAMKLSKNWDHLMSTMDEHLPKWPKLTAQTSD